MEMESAKGDGNNMEDLEKDEVVVVNPGMDKTTHIVEKSLGALIDNIHVRVGGNPNLQQNENSAAPQSLPTTSSQASAKAHRALYRQHLMLLKSEVSSFRNLVAALNSGTSWETLKFSRQRKQEVERKAIELVGLWESYAEVRQPRPGDKEEEVHALRQQHDTTEVLKEAEVTLSQLELTLVQQPRESEHHVRPANTTFMERLPTPVFSGERLAYPDFKQLFQDLVSPLRLKDSAYIEYMKKALPANLRELLRGAVDITESWRRLDKIFDDKPGAVRQIIKNLIEVDIS